MTQTSTNILSEAGRLLACTNARSGALKRVFDVIVSLTILPIAGIFIAMAYLAVRLEGGPGFYGHKRVGQGGKEFRCWKIRTMVPDAQQRLTKLLERDPKARAEWNCDRKLRDDPRVTRLGVFLRTTSLDELPQILNVIKGEMSLVGPRPITMPELERYSSAQNIYKSLKPGITGLWQVSGRNDVSYDERVAFDIEYSRTIGLHTDIRILFRTVFVVLNKTGC